MSKKVYNVIGSAIMLSAALMAIFYGLYILSSPSSREQSDARVYAIYEELWVQTGQTQDMLPLSIVDSDEINAYNDGNKIVIYTGLINSTKSWDEVALILGHEIAHGNLYHLRMLIDKTISSDNDVQVLEANADKMGAVYALKAGYNVCTGREIFKRWINEGGDYLGGTHPNNAYRYSELNLGCE